jgi:hypothetical protein
LSWRRFISGWSRCIWIMLRVPFRVKGVVSTITSSVSRAIAIA